jgi:SAM-dependent MidA family methyltransferase
MNALERIIRAEIGEAGPMRFDRFMALALYHPEHGYYAAPRAIGRGGDFITSVSVGPLFGRMLAQQARQMAELLDEAEFWIVEQGAHDGQLARDILEAARTMPEFHGRLRYLIVEPSRQLREAQQNILASEAGRVSWIAGLQDGTETKPAGLFLSNELVDAFPVRLIERGAEAWLERCVDIDANDELSWRACAMDAGLRTAAAALPLPDVAGYRTEINLAARKWMRDVAGFLRRGYVVTIDYGFPASACYAPFRRDGTLTCYRGHRRGSEVLRDLGEQDITAHVDFTALIQAGKSAGLEPLALVDQGRFLIGILQGAVAAGGDPGGAANDAPALKMLTHPDHFGGRFQVLVQAKDAPAGLHGLAFARPGGFD